MPIKTVCYRRNVSIGEFQHVHVEAAVDVAEGEDPKAALNEARAFVMAALVAERAKAATRGRDG